MTPDDEKTRSALLTAAKDFLTANATITTESGSFTSQPTMAETSIAVENRKFNPKNLNPWARVSIIPAATSGVTVGKGGFDLETGVMQIDINIAQDVGEFEIIPWATKARIFFHSGRTFTFETHSVLVNRTEISQGRNFESFFRKSISVNFKSYLKRHQVT